MGKLSDPAFFDGGDRGSLTRWLHSMDPWTIAEPLHGFALGHPVGSGLTVAFLQIIVGVLTVLGLWQRLAAGVGAMLAVALLATVSWRADGAYDASDIICLAAWSPLIIAGAPVYSLDGRLAAEAWRTLGPRSDIWQLRRRVLRRGAVFAAIAIGLTLLIGSSLGAAVRSAHTVRVPEPGEPPVNHLPGSPLPTPPGGKARGGPAGTSGPSEPAGPSSQSPSPATSGPVAETGELGGGPSQRAEQAPPPAPGSEQPAPRTPTTGGSSSGGADGGSSTGSTGGAEEDPPGLVGGLLG
jgi:uncharacterized membrane protein YphA (DoxX/SURF4 family)